MMEQKDILQEIVTVNGDYEALLQQVGDVLQRGRVRAADVISTIAVETNWEIGRYIVEYEQKGHEKAEYGSQTLKRLAGDLAVRYGKGFGHSNINNMRRLYLTYPNLQTLSANLSWSTSLLEQKRMNW